MGLSFKNIKSALSRIKTGFQVSYSPENFYLYPKEVYLYHNLSYSQEGEDMILSRLFSEQTKGFYVDVGAHHPQRFSNTYYFYLQGWRGINIDAMPGSMEIFKKLRPNDINLELPIYDSQQTLTYYEFNEPALNGFCEKTSQERDGLKHYKIISKKELETYTLAEILDKYLSPNQEIDFLNIDVEGLDYQVLNSNNWEKYRPKIVLVEDLTLSSISKINESKIAVFMDKQDYKLYAKAVFTLIFTAKN
jgi:FkbM family methyltransferase